MLLLLFCLHIVEFKSHLLVLVLCKHVFKDSRKFDIRSGLVLCFL